ncbi:MAG: PAS domain S-box protein, partial [Blastochloris sp.]|nr:PAS domain S-box protein [Blastochloris sp.]
MLNEHDGAVVQVEPSARKSAPRRKATTTTMPTDTEHHFVETLIDGYYETDLDGCLTWANASLCRMLGRAQTEVAGLRLVRLDAGDVPARAFARVLETGAPEPIVEGMLARPAGEVLLTELSVSLRRDAAGQPSGFFGIVRDVSERQDFQHELQRQVDILSTLQQVDVELSYKLDVDLVLNIAMRGAAILSNATTGFIALCEDGKLTAIRTFGGLTPNALHDDGTPHDGILRRVMVSGLPALVPDVTLDPEYVSVVPQTRSKIVMPLSAHGKLLAVLNLETDDPTRFSIDEFDFLKMLAKHIATALDNAVLHQVLQKQLSELTSLYQEKTELEKLKTDMIRTVTHDVRSPLTIITGYISVLGDELRGILNAGQLVPDELVNDLARRPLSQWPATRELRPTMAILRTVGQARALHPVLAAVSLEIDAVVGQEIIGRQRVVAHTEGLGVAGDGCAAQALEDADLDLVRPE